MSEQDQQTPSLRPDMLGRPPQAAPSAPGGAEQVPYIDDPWTKWFVLLVTAVFVAIFLNAVFLGHGGLLTTTPSPSPTPVASASPSPSPTTSPSSTASASPAPSASGSPAAASPTPATSPSPTPSASP